MNTTRRCTQCGELCELLDDARMWTELLSNCHTAPVVWDRPHVTGDHLAAINMIAILQPLCAQFSRDHGNVPLKYNPYFSMMEGLEEKLPDEAKSYHCKVHGWNAILTTKRNKDTIPYSEGDVECAACLEQDETAHDTCVWGQEIDDKS